MTAERSRNHNTYHRVTTSFEYVLVGNDFALASPVKVCTVQVDKKIFTNQQQVGFHFNINT